MLYPLLESTNGCYNNTSLYYTVGFSKIIKQVVLQRAVQDWLFILFILQDVIHIEVLHGSIHIIHMLYCIE